LMACGPFLDSTFFASLMFGPWKLLVSSLWGVVCSVCHADCLCFLSSKNFSPQGLADNYQHGSFMWTREVWAGGGVQLLTWAKTSSLSFGKQEPGTGYRDCWHMAHSCSHSPILCKVILSKSLNFWASVYSQTEWVPQCLVCVSGKGWIGDFLECLPTVNQIVAASWPPAAEERA
jgi:hypothetical protein